MHPTCWEIATLFEPQLTEPGQVDGLLVDVDGTGEPKTAQALALGFELGVADLAFPLARSLQLAAAKEPGEGVLQVTQGFLRSGASGLSSSALHGRVHHFPHAVVFSLEENSGIGIEDVQDGLWQCNAAIPYFEDARAWFVRLNARLPVQASLHEGFKARNDLSIADQAYHPLPCPEQP